MTPWLPGVSVALETSSPRAWRNNNCSSVRKGAPNRSTRAHRPPIGRAAASRIQTPWPFTRISAWTGPSVKPKAVTAACAVSRMRPLNFLRLARRCNVDGFLEIGAFQRVGFVEERQGLELSRGDHAFEREFAPWNIVFDEQIADLHAGDARRRFDEFFPIVGTDDAPAGGGIERLQNAGKLHVSGSRVSRRHRLKPRYQHSGCSKTFPGQQLIRRRASRFGGMKA